MFILFHNKVFVRKNSEPSMNSLFLSQSSEALSVEQNHSLDVSIESSQMTASHSLHMLVSTMLSGKKPEEVREVKIICCCQHNELLSVFHVSRSF
ncbi:kinesin-like protein KIN-14P [Carex rostrata]